MGQVARGLLVAMLGLVVVPRDKLLRAGEAIRETLAGRAEFSIYRSLCGLLEHLRAVNLSGRNVMHGLYAPHGPGGASDDGPSALVTPDLLMCKQLNRWLGLLERSGGANVKRAISREELEAPPGVYYQLCSDAMYEFDRTAYIRLADVGEDADAGVGGFLHGDYWVFVVPDEDIPFLSIPILEFLGVCGNVLVFERALTAAAHGNNRIVLRTDALTAALTLPAESQRSPLLVAAYQWLRARPELAAIADHVIVAHLFGDANPISDAISRRKWAEFSRLCAQMGVRPHRLELPPAFHELYALVRDLAITQGMRAGADEPSSFLDRIRAAPSVAPAATSTALVAPATTTAPPSPQRPSLPPSFAERFRASPEAARPLGAAAASPASRRPLAISAVPGPARAVGGLALPPAPPSTSRAASAMRAAGQRYAQARAAALAEGGGDMALRAHISTLTSTADVLEEVGDYGVNANTARVEERAWVLWEDVCEAQGTSPLRTAEDARTRPERNAHLLALLLLHAFTIGVPKTKGAHFIKPRSALAYPLAIVRVFTRWGVMMPSYKLLKSALSGLMRMYIAYHGPYSLAPRRAEPFLFPMVRTIVAIADGTVMNVGGRASRTWRLADHDCFMFTALVCFLMVTAFRLGEIVRHTSGEIMYLTRESLTWRINGRVIAEPTEAELDSMVIGRDRAEVAPPRSKPDQWGETHCPFAVPLVLGPEPENAARWLREIERRAPCSGASRRTTPLFCDAREQPYTHAVLDALLKFVLTYLYGAAAASLYSWHSFRVGLATALHAAGVPDAMIQLICRWMCPESLHIYRRVGTAEHTVNLQAASRASIDVLQSANVPRVTADDGFHWLMSELGEARAGEPQRAFEAERGNARPPAALRTEAGRPTPTAPRAPAPTPAPAAVLQPLRGVPRPRDMVVVPHDVYPTYQCAELGGAGWAARVCSATGRTALVEYEHATGRDGQRFERVRLPLTSLCISG